MFRRILYSISNQELQDQLKNKTWMIEEEPSEPLGEEDLLFTDLEEKAFEARKKGACVIAVLTEDNRECFFEGIRYAVEDMEEPEQEYLEQIYKRHKGIPWKILETERCLVREICLADVDRLYEIYAEPSITEFLEPLYEDPDQERSYTKQYIDGIYGFYGYGMWIVEEKQTGRIIGRAGIEYKQELDGAELGYLIAEDYQKQGYATEVCRAVLEYARQELGFCSIYSFIRQGNKTSCKLCEKLGFQKEKEEGDYMKYKKVF